MSDYEESQAREARLVILKAIAMQPERNMNETLIGLALDNYGIRKSRDWLRTQLTRLEEFGAVRIARIDRPEAGPVIIVTIAPAGIGHLSGRAAIEGIMTPSRWE